MSFSIILVCRNSVENNIKLFFLFSSAREKLTKLYSVNYHLMWIKSKGWWVLHIL